MSRSDKEKSPGYTTYDDVGDDLLNASKALWPKEDAQEAHSAPNGPPSRAGKSSGQSGNSAEKLKQDKPTRKSRPTKALQSDLSSKPAAAPIVTTVVAASTQNSVTPRFRNIVRDVTILSGESKKEYQEFVSLVESDLCPRTGTEFIFVSRFAHIQWDIRRIHIWRDELRRSCAKEAFLALLERQLQGLDEDARAALWADGTPTNKAKRLMEKAGLSETTLVAHGLAKNLSLFEALDVMEARLEMRGHAMLHELERHREAQGRLSRSLIEGTSPLQRT